MLSLSLNLNATRRTPWWQQSDLAAIDSADGRQKFAGLIARFGSGRFAMTTLSAGAIASAPANQLGAATAVTFADLFTFTRSSSAAFIDAAGQLQMAAADIPRFDYTNGKRQLLLEGAATNTIRNNSMQGAASGSPGMLPTNWSFEGTTPTYSVIGTGTENGIDYVEIDFSGSGTFALPFEVTGIVAAAQNQVWVSSFYIKLTAGSLNNVTLQNAISPLSGSGANLTAGLGSTITPTSAALGTQRTSFVYTLPDATTAFVRSRLRVAATGAYSFRLRIGMPQLEQASQPSSVIRTTSAAVTRAADSCAFSAKALALIARTAAGAVVKGQGFSPAGGRLIGGVSSSIVRVRAGDSAIGQTAVLASSGALTIPTSSLGVSAGWDAGGKAISLDGSTIATDLTALDANLSSAFLGRDSGGSFANGWYNELVIYPFKPTDLSLVSKAVAHA